MLKESYSESVEPEESLLTYEDREKIRVVDFLDIVPRLSVETLGIKINEFASNPKKSHRQTF